jgi:hypothetical protein
MPDRSGRSLRRWIFASTLTVTVIATAACGTTVSSNDLARTQTSTSAGSDSGLSINPTPDGGSPDSAEPIPETTAAGGDDIGPSPSTRPSRHSGKGGTKDSPSASPSTSVIAKGPIKIGVITVAGAADFQKSLGFSGATGDQVAMTRSVVSYINAHGGYGGRKVQLVSYDLNPNAVTGDQSAAMQAACTFFTQDHKVTAIASYAGLAPDSFYTCLAKAQVPIVTPDEGVPADFFRRFPNTVYMPQTPNYTRLLADSVDALWNAGWLTAKSTVGVVGYDTPNVHDIVNTGLIPALRRHGLKLTTGLYTGTTTAAAAQYVGGVLSFKTKRVDRVFFAPGGQPVYFALAAATQGYRPHYELGSLDYPTPLAANLPADQLAGSMGLSWLPYLDLPSNKWSSVKTPGIAECRKAMASAHQDFSTGTTLGIAAWICDDWMFLRAVFAAGASPDAAGIRRAAESLNNSFRPASTFRTSFSPGRTHDGASGYRLIAFQSACKCYAYVSGVRAMQ